MNVTFPKLKWPWAEPEYQALQKWIDQMRDLFNGRISFSKNMAADKVTFDFVAGSTPSKKVPLTERPMGVIPLSLQQIEPASSAPPSVPDNFSWTFANGSLTFPALGAITGSAKYRCTVLVVKE
jgi:hypothetical protein